MVKKDIWHILLRRFLYLTIEAFVCRCMRGCPKCADDLGRLLQCSISSSPWPRRHSLCHQLEILLFCCRFRISRFESSRQWRIVDRRGIATKKKNRNRSLRKKMTFFILIVCHAYPFPVPALVLFLAPGLFEALSTCRSEYSGLHGSCSDCASMVWIFCC